MYQAIRELGYSPGLEAPGETTPQPDTLAEDSPLFSAFDIARNEGKLVFADFPS